MSTSENFFENKEQNVVLSNQRKRRIEQGSVSCKEINYENVKEAVDKKLILDLNNQTFFVDRDGTFPSLLYAALKNNDTDLIDYLINQRINLNFIEEGKMPFIFKIMTTPWHKYFIYENKGNQYLYDVIERSVKAGLDVNASKWNGYSPLSHSLIHGHGKIAELLINAGADVDPPCAGKGCGGCSPISRAVYSKLDKVIDLLLIKGCKINSKNCPRSYFPLNMALHRRDIERASRFINVGADVEAIDSPCGASLCFAMDDVRTVEFLLNNTFVDVNFQVIKEFNSINFFNHRNSDRIECLDRLLNAVLDINVITEMNRFVAEKFYRKKKTIPILKNHLVKLWAAGFYSIDQYIAAILGEENDKFYAKCCQEVDSMKETKVSPASHINFYDVLFMTYEKLALCLESLDDQGILQSNLQEKFPSYAGMIKFRFTRANLWMKLREKVNVAVYHLFNNHLPSTIMEKILSYFSITELMKVQINDKKEEAEL